MIKLDLYHVTDRYIDYLRNFDDKVPYNKGQKRPFVGVVLKVFSQRYFVPLSSPKPKHKKMFDNRDIYKISRGKSGILNFNNMIPIPKSELIPIVIKNEVNLNYRNLLNSQLKELIKNATIIKNKAKNIYNIYQNPQNDSDRKIIKRCCNFEILETACMNYKKEE